MIPYIETRLYDSQLNACYWINIATPFNRLWARVSRDFSHVNWVSEFQLMLSIKKRQFDTWFRRESNEQIIDSEIDWQCCTTIQYVIQKRIERTNHQQKSSDNNSEDDNLIRVQTTNRCIQQFIFNSHIHNSFNSISMTTHYSRHSCTFILDALNWSTHSRLFISASFLL